VTQFNSLDRSDRNKFEILKIQDGGRQPSCKIEKSPLSPQRLTDRNEIWHMVTYTGFPKGTSRYNLELLKIQDGERPPSFKIEILQYLY